MNYPNVQQWAIILETISFGLVTLDLYGQERLAELTLRLNKKLSNLIELMARSSPFVSLSEKSNFIFSSLYYIWKAIKSTFLQMYNIFRSLFKLKQIEIDKVTEIEIEQIERFINLLFRVLIITIITGITAQICFYPILGYKKTNLIFLFVYGFILLSYSIGFSIKILSKGRYDILKFVDAISIIPLIFLAIIIGILFIPVFFFYYFLIPSALALPLFLIIVILEMTLKIFTKLHLKNIMIILGTILFLTSKYLSYISS